MPPAPSSRSIRYRSARAPEIGASAVISRSRLLDWGQRRESLARVGDAGLELRIGVLPDVDERAVLLDSFVGLTHRLVQLSQPLTNRRQANRVHLDAQFVPVRRRDIPLEEQRRGIRLPGGVIRPCEVE